MSELGENPLKSQSNSNNLDDSLSNSTKFKNNILNYYFNSKSMNSDEILNDEYSLENSISSNKNENLVRSLSKTDDLNFNYTLKNNEVYYSPNRTFIEELEYETILNPPRTTSVNMSNLNLIGSGQTFPSIQSRVQSRVPSRMPSRKSFINDLRPTQLRMSSNLFIDYNVRNNVFSNQSSINPLIGSSNNQPPFDALTARRKMFNEMSGSTMSLRPQNNNYPQNYTQNYPPANSNPVFSGAIESRMSPVSNQGLGTAAFNETIVSNNVEDLIDVMAKRRLAIKNLENEMNRQHSRGTSLVKSFNPEPSRIDVNTRPQVDIYNPFYERQTRNAPGYDPQTSFLGRAPVRNMNEPYYESPKPSSNIISNIEYPSETNREIYSTYLVDSIKPHYSARRLVSGKPFPLNPTTPQTYAPKTSMAPQPNQQVFPNYNQSNTQPILENYRQAPVQPIVNNYGPVYNQPVMRDPSNDPGLNQTFRQNENIQTQNSLTKKPSIHSSMSQANSKNSGVIYDTLRDDKPVKKLDFEQDESDKANFDNSTPRVNKTSFYLNENEQNYMDPKLSSRSLQKKSLEPIKQTDISRKESLNIDIRSPVPANESQSNTNKKLNETYRIKSKLEQKFPKLYDRQRLFWAAATIVRFIMRIKLKSKQISNNPDRTGSASIFRIRLLEIMTAVHRVYLEPEGPIYTAMMTFLRNENDMNALFDTENQIHNECVQTLCQNVEEIVQRITEFMPKEGIIGTTAKSALLSLISEGNKFPDNYFWDEEKERLKFDENGKIKNINRGRAILILMSAMISRGLITTLLIKPIKFRLLRGDIPAHMKVNLKILATIMCYIVRKVNNKSEIPLNFPWEWQSSLYNDLKMKPLYKNPDIIFTVDQCRKLFISWANEYITRLDETAGLTR